MNLQITSQNKTSHLLIVSKGVLSVKEDLFKQTELIYREIIKHKHSRILIEESQTSFPQSLFTYSDLVKFYQDFPPEARLLKIAIVIPATDTDRKIADFWEVACLNKGFDFRAFSSAKEAENWLIK